MKISEMIDRVLPTKGWKVFAIAVAGVVVGGGLFFLYLLRAHTYIADDPSAQGISVHTY